MIRYILRGLLVLVVLAIAVVIGALSYRAWRQHENAGALAINSPNGIDEQTFVHINGIDQWITIRGEDRKNPVLLILAGGPGNTLVPLAALFKPWEKFFTIVQWDQRGAGKTFEQNGEAGEGAMTIGQFTADGIKLTEFLRTHLNKDKIVILGNSWGTVLGVRMAKARPDYFTAYVGAGQVVDTAAQESFDYAAVMAKAQSAHDTDSIGALQRIGAPPYRSTDDLLVERGVAQHYVTGAERDLRAVLTPMVLFSPNYSLGDVYASATYDNFAGKAMIKEILSYDARKLGPDFALPMYIFNGDQDAVTPTPLAQAWFATIRAPKKGFVILKGGGHSALLTMPDAFLRELVARVRPVSN